LVLIEGKDIGSNNLSPLTFSNVVADFDLVDCCKEDYTRFVFHNYQGSSIEYRFGDSELVVLDYKRACAKLFEKLNSSGKQAVYINQHVINLYQHEDRVLVHLEDNTQIQSKIVIDASGKSQFVAGVYKRNGVHYYSHICGGVFSNVRNPKEKLCCFLLSNPVFGSGGGWFYSIGNNRASFGYATISNSPNPDCGALRENFKRASEKFEPYSQYLVDSKLEHFELGVIPISYVSRFVDGKIIIVGDAAGMATNWMCMGIEPALRYGKLAGEIAAKALCRNDFRVLNEYQDLWERDNKRTFDLAAQNTTAFWFSGHYYWEWIIKNDLAFLSPDQLIDRMRKNDHLLTKSKNLYRSIKFKIKSFLNKEVLKPYSYVITS
jgi:digeranylgeranylglycerophospholipid reductase